MTEFYSASEYLTIKNSKRNLLIGYFISLAVCLAIIVAIMIIYANEPYGTSLRTPFLIALIAIIVLFVTYSFVFFNIKIGRLKKYQYFVYYAIYGRTETTKATVVAVNNSITDFGGFDCRSLDVLVWSDIENDYVTRLIYYDVEKDIGDVKVDDVLTLKLSSNYVVAFKKENL